jgi:hypothetical protein
VYIFNGASAKRVSDPVDNIYRDLIRLNESLSEAENVNSILNVANDEYWLIFDGWKVLVWNYVENAWSFFLLRDSEGQPLNITSFGYTFTEFGALRYDEAQWTYGADPNTYFHYRAAASHAEPFALGDGHYFSINMETARQAKLIWGEANFERPVTLTRVIFEGAPNGEVTFTARLYTRGGKEILASAEITLSDTMGGGGPGYGLMKPTARGYWNVVGTSLDFQLEIELEGQPGFELSSIVLDLVAGDLPAEEETTPQAGETLTALFE